MRTHDQVVAKLMRRPGVRNELERIERQGGALGRLNNPPHSGEVLQEWLDGVSITLAATRLGVTRASLSRIMNGHTGISADMALRLSALLGTSAELWLGMQSAYDLWQASRQPRPRVERLVLAA